MRSASSTAAHPVVVLPVAQEDLREVVPLPIHEPLRYLFEVFVLLRLEILQVLLLDLDDLLRPLGVALVFVQLGLEVVSVLQRVVVVLPLGLPDLDEEVARVGLRLVRQAPLDRVQQLLQLVDGLAAHIVQRLLQVARDLERALVLGLRLDLHDIRVVGVHLLQHLAVIVRVDLHELPALVGHHRRRPRRCTLLAAGPPGAARGPLRLPVGAGGLLTAHAPHSLGPDGGFLPPLKRPKHGTSTAAVEHSGAQSPSRAKSIIA